MKTIRPLIAFLGPAALAWSLFGCVQEEDVCDDYCASVRDCYEMNDVWFSVSRCRRDCNDERQGYDLIGCKSSFEQLRDCQAGLSCAAQGEVGDKCASEIDIFDKCVD